MASRFSEMKPVGNNRFKDPQTGELYDFKGVNPATGKVRVVPVPVDTETGAGFGERARASFGGWDAEDQLRSWESIRGKGNARISPQDGSSIEIFDKNQWRRVDPSGLDMGDLADLVGKTPELAASVAGGALLAGTAPLSGPAAAIGLSALGSGIGAGAGDAARQIADALLPGGGEEKGVGERLQDIGQATAMGAAGEVIGQLLMRGAGKALRAAPKATNKLTSMMTGVSEQGVSELTGPQGKLVMDFTNADPATVGRISEGLQEVITETKNTAGREFAEKYASLFPKDQAFDGTQLAAQYQKLLNDMGLVDSAGNMREVLPKTPWLNEAGEKLTIPEALAMVKTANDAVEFRRMLDGLIGWSNRGVEQIGTRGKTFLKRFRTAAEEAEEAAAAAVGRVDDYKKIKADYADAADTHDFLATYFGHDQTAESTTRNINSAAKRRIREGLDKLVARNPAAADIVNKAKALAAAREWEVLMPGNKMDMGRGAAAVLTGIAAGDPTLGAATLLARAPAVAKYPVYMAGKIARSFNKAADDVISKTGNKGRIAEAFEGGERGPIPSPDVPQTPPAAPAAAAPEPKQGRSGVWRNKDVDMPVTVVGDAGTGPDGRKYVKIAESKTAVPADEVVYSGQAEPKEPTQQVASRAREKGEIFTSGDGSMPMRGQRGKGPFYTPEGDEYFYNERGIGEFTGRTKAQAKIEDDARDLAISEQRAAAREAKRGTPQMMPESEFRNADGSLTEGTSVRVDFGKQAFRDEEGNPYVMAQRYFEKDGTFQRTGEPVRMSITEQQFADRMGALEPKPGLLNSFLIRARDTFNKLADGSGNEIDGLASKAASLKSASGQTAKKASSETISESQSMARSSENALGGAESNANLANPPEGKGTSATGVEPRTIQNADNLGNEDIGSSQVDNNVTRNSGAVKSDDDKLMSRKRADLPGTGDFAEMTKDNLRRAGYGAAINERGNIVAYHGTSTRNAKAIERSGSFNGNPWFTVNEETAKKFAQQAGPRPTVIKVEIDPDAIVGNGDYLSTRMEGLTRNEDGVYGLWDKDSDRLMSRKRGEIDDYAGSHRPPMRDSGAPLHDVTGNGTVYPDDVYSPQAVRYYGTGEEVLDRQTMALVNQFKGRPNAMVKIYRAVPHTKSNAERIAELEAAKSKYMSRGKVPEGEAKEGYYDRVSAEIERLKTAPEPKVISDEISQGDWVTINRDYAKQHGESALRGEYKIISKRVKASDIFTNGDSIHEWGYDPADADMRMSRKRDFPEEQQSLFSKPKSASLFPQADKSKFGREEQVSMFADQPDELRLVAQEAPRAQDRRSNQQVAEGQGQQRLLMSRANAKTIDQPAEKGPIFYSHAVKTLEQSRPGKLTGEQWLGFLKNKGVKDEEFEFTGLADWLQTQKQAIPREDVLDYVNTNQVQVEEVLKDSATAHLLGGADDVTKFDQYTAPGGENYRELLLTLPSKQPPPAGRLEELPNGKFIVNTPGGTRQMFATREAAEAEMRRLGEIFNKDKAGNFESSHFDEPNVLAHVRFNERTVDGKKTLFIEEIQSDWHQKGRKSGYAGDEKTTGYMAYYTGAAGQEVPVGFGATEEAALARVADDFKAHSEIKVKPTTRKLGATEGVPNAPFKTAWPELAMKRMIRWASENGFDRVAWTPGEMQAARYDLSKQISSVAYSGTNLKAFDLNGEEIITRTGVSPEDLPDIIGKEATEKLLAAPKRGTLQMIEGEDLKVGGEGMRGFYDKILPTVANKLAKKHGGKVGQMELPRVNEAGTHEKLADVAPVHYFDVTPSMKQEAMAGQRLMSRKRKPDLDAPKAGAPKLTVAQGKETTAADTNRDRYKMRYELVEEDDLIVSHDSQLNVNPKFPPELQPRDRTSADSREQIRNMAKNFDDEAVLHDTKTIYDGIPIVSKKSNAVIAGNGRKIAERIRYKSKAARENRRADLLARASEYGIDPEAIKAAKKPAIVRRLVDDIDEKQFAILSNEPGVSEQGLVDAAKTTATRLDDAWLTQLKIDAPGKFDDAMRQNVDLSTKVVQALPQSKRGSLVDKKGNLSQMGRARIRDAMFAKTYNGDEGEALLAEIADVEDEHLKSLKTVLFDSLPAVARQEAAIRTGAADPAMSVANDIMAATQKRLDMAKSKLSKGDFLAQESMFTMTGTQQALFDFMVDNTQAPARIAEVFHRFALAAGDIAPPEQNVMFQVERATKQEILAKVLRDYAADVADKKGGAKAAAAAEKAAAQVEAAPEEAVRPMFDESAPAKEGSAIPKIEEKPKPEAPEPVAEVEKPATLAAPAPAIDKLNPPAKVDPADVPAGMHFDKDGKQYAFDKNSGERVYTGVVDKTKAVKAPEPERPKAPTTPPPPKYPVRRDVLEDVIDRMKRKMPGLRAVVVKEPLVDKKGNKVRAWLNPNSGRIEVSPDIDSVEDAVEALLHEEVGHRGIIATLGSGMKKTLDRVKRRYPAKVQRRVENWGISADEAAEEVLAEISELNLDKTDFLDDVFGRIREVAASSFGVKLSDRDIRFMLSRAARHVEGTGTRPMMPGYGGAAGVASQQ